MMFSDGGGNIALDALWVRFPDAPTHSGTTPVENKPSNLEDDKEYIVILESRKEEFGMRVPNEGMSNPSPFRFEVSLLLLSFFLLMSDINQALT